MLKGIGVGMNEGNRLRKYLIVGDTKEEFLIKAASLQQAHQLAIQMNMKVKAVFYEHPDSYGLDNMWEYV
jgi:hypothetical protein